MFLRLVFICLFWFLGITHTYAREVLDKVVAVVNDEVITDSDVKRKLAETKQQLQKAGKVVPNEKKLYNKILNQLVNTNLQLQLAKQNQMNIDDMELNEAIELIAKTNNLTMEQLQETIEKSGMSWGQYRENMKQQVLLSRLQQKALAKDIHVTDKQVDDYLKKPDHFLNASLLYHLQNITVPLSDEPSATEVAAAQAKANEVFELANKSRDLSTLAITASDTTFILNSEDLGARHLAELPEIYANEVEHMKKNQVAGPLRTGSGFQIIKLLEINDDNGSMNISQTHVRHILLKPSPSMTEAEAQSQVDHIYRQLLAGKSFAKLAEKYSLDLTTSKNGGDLGWVSPGETIPGFEKAMNKLQLNQISKPVKTNFGWHIIQVLARRNVEDNETMKRHKIRQYLQRRQFQEALQRWVQELRTQAFVKIINLPDNITSDNKKSIA